MIQPILTIEDTAYLGESIRIDVSKSILTSNEPAIISIMVTPEAGALAIDCTVDEHLDVVYSAIGAKTITVAITNTNGTTTASFPVVVTCVDPATLNLFSKDTDLVPFEPEVFKNLPNGWSKFTRMHKRAQDTILDSLDEKNVMKIDPNTGAYSRYQALDIYDAMEVRSWSVALVLSYLFEGLIKTQDDIFTKKALKYFTLAETRASRASVRLKSADVTSLQPEIRDMISTRMERA